jgi:hypothetical protein
MESTGKLGHVIGVNRDYLPSCKDAVIRCCIAFADHDSELVAPGRRICEMYNLACTAFMKA